ncbi:hypothetical protein F4775DRAFT_283413 [Biscogniauxia sp. FL1348]|nr:hypothetical protein F4775DRAFT_283413 [Biscogniauxia sp. FL1348]
MPAETTISTPLPAGISPEAVIAALHNHELYIRTTCPQLISYHKLSSPPSSSSSPAEAEGSSSDIEAGAGVGQSCSYEVTDKRPIGQTTYKLTLTRQRDGTDAVVEGRAPAGGALLITSRWRVRAGALDESVEIDSNLLMKKMVKGNVEKTHPDHHQGFLAEAARA